jgi:hypothetical protein
VGIAADLRSAHPERSQQGAGRAASEADKGQALSIRLPVAESNKRRELPTIEMQVCSSHIAGLILVLSYASVQNILRFTSNMPVCPSTQNILPAA